ncbi:hypothetical protein LCGC14_2755590, partial [marine sediment metagenome]
ELELKNYKIFKELKIDFDQCNVFVGPNSSGKSSIAEFLIFFREFIRQFSGRIKFHYDIADFLNNALSIGQEKPLFFKIKLIIGEFLYEYKANLSRELNTNTIWANECFIIKKIEDNLEVFNGSVDIQVNYPRIEGWMRSKGLSLGNYQKKIQGNFPYLENSILKNIFQDLTKKDRFFYVFNQFWEYWDNIRLYDSNRYDKKKIVEISELSNDIIISENFQNLISVLLNINLQQKEVFEEIGDWLIRLMINFKELRLKMSDKKGRGEILFSEKNGPNPILIPLKWASDGIIRLLCILTILFNKEKPALMIFDEPENGFHPAIRDSIVDFSIAASDKSQLIYITHDSESLRHFELNRIYYFKREGRFTEVKRLSEVESLTETIKALKDVEKNTLVSTHSSNSL